MKTNKKILTATIGGSLIAAAFAATLSFTTTVNALETIQVWKSPTCGCCKKWVSHLQEKGFSVIEHNTQDMQSIKRDFGVPAKIRSCHTAKVGNYVIEGHVPASDIKRLLKSKSTQISVLSTPGMPAGSPGMEMGDRKDPYPVIAYTKDKEFKLFNYYNSKK